MDENNSEEKEEKAKIKQEQNKDFLIDDYPKPIRPISGTTMVVSVLKKYTNGLTIKEIASHMKKIKPDLKVQSFEERAKYVVANWLKPMNFITIENGKVRLILKNRETSKIKLKENKKKSAKKSLLNEYLPTKSDLERVIKKISRSTTETEFDLKEIFIELEKYLSGKGTKLKSNWKIITKENMKLWFK